MSETSPLLKINSLFKSFESEVPVVHNAHLEVNENEIIALLGPSGCGKTTTLRMIAGFEQVDEGEIFLKGELIESREVHVPAQKRGIGFVFQDYALFPHMSVQENVAFGLHAIPAHKRNVYAEEVLCRTGMEKFKHRSPAELSGGQQQRVALARALAPRPQLILMDEPFSGLDAMLKDATRKEVRSILKKSNMSAILVTHDQEEALSFADKVAVMNNGVIEQVGTPEQVYYNPKTQFIAQFLGRTNLFRAHANNSDIVETRIGKVALNKKASGLVLCSLRPEHIGLKKPDTSGETAGIITGREFRGHDITYHVLFNGDTYIVHTDNRKLFNPNDSVVVVPLEPAVVLEGNPTTPLASGEV